MKNIKKQLGFSAVELLITLFVAAAFLISGFQLYAVVIKDGGEARLKVNASNVAMDYLQQYKSSATNPCTNPSSLPTDSPISGVNGLSNVTLTVSITCPYSAITSISKVSVTIKYGTPQQTITDATYVKP